MGMPSPVTGGDRHPAFVVADRVDIAGCAWTTHRGRRPMLVSNQHPKECFPLGKRNAVAADNQRKMRGRRNRCLDLEHSDRARAGLVAGTARP